MEKGPDIENSVEKISGASPAHGGKAHAAIINNRGEMGVPCAWGKGSKISKNIFQGNGRPLRMGERLGYRYGNLHRYGRPRARRKDAPVLPGTALSRPAIPPGQTHNHDKEAA